MGHMNVQYYVAAFDQAMWHLVHALGYRTEWQKEKGEGWADVQHNVTFSQELAVGSLFYVDSGVASVGGKSLTTVHRLYNMSGELCAADEVKSVYFDLVARKGLPLPDAIRANAEREVTKQSVSHPT
jgi:acyl-CoA thioester hydrolase